MSQPNVLVFQNIAHCPLETIGECLAGDRIAPRIVRLHEGQSIPDLAPFDALFVLGGPMDVWQTDEHPWLIPEKEAIRTWVETLDRPMLGICLGHQLLADAMGGEVGPASRPEAGVSEILLGPGGQQHPLMEGFGPSKRAISFHSSEIKRLPARAVSLASTADCRHSAIAVASAAFGVQYHAEATDRLVSDWTDREAGRALARQLHGADGVAMVRRSVSSAMPELRSNAARLYDNFMRIVRNRIR